MRNGTSQTRPGVLSSAVDSPLLEHAAEAETLRENSSFSLKDSVKRSHKNNEIKEQSCLFLSLALGASFPADCVEERDRPGHQGLSFLDMYIFDPLR